uniref:Sorbin and SH3 domain containing 3 n=1 Tax=Cairina moschata TaxID=8855 RepID=A0A8C3BYY8_CAIMO
MGPPQDGPPLVAGSFLAGIWLLWGAHPDVPLVPTSPPPPRAPRGSAGCALPTAGHGWGTRSPEKLRAGLAARWVGRGWDEADPFPCPARVGTPCPGAWLSPRGGAGRWLPTPQGGDSGDSSPWGGGGHPHLQDPHPHPRAPGPRGSIPGGLSSSCAPGWNIFGGTSPAVTRRSPLSPRRLQSPPGAPHPPASPSMERGGLGLAGERSRAAPSRDLRPGTLPSLPDFGDPAEAVKREEKKMKAARLKFDFRAESPKELTLQKGDIVYIHKEVDRNWLEGEHHGRVGIFPSNYVEVLPPTEVPKPIKAPSIQVLEYGEALALYNFRGELPVELSFRKGERVCLVRRVLKEPRVKASADDFPPSPASASPRLPAVAPSPQHSPGPRGPQVPAGSPGTPRRVPERGPGDPGGCPSSPHPLGFAFPPSPKLPRAGAPAPSPSPALAWPPEQVSCPHPHPVTLLGLRVLPHNTSPFLPPAAPSRGGTRQHPPYPFPILQRFRNPMDPVPGSLPVPTPKRRRAGAAGRGPRGRDAAVRRRLVRGGVPEDAEIRHFPRQLRGARVSGGATAPRTPPPPRPPTGARSPPSSCRPYGVPLTGTNPPPGALTRPFFRSARCLFAHNPVAVPLRVVPGGGPRWFPGPAVTAATRDAGPGAVPRVPLLRVQH